MPIRESKTTVVKNQSIFENRVKDYAQEDIEKGQVINEDIAEHILTSNARENEDGDVNIGPAISAKADQR